MKSFIVFMSLLWLVVGCAQHETALTDDPAQQDPHMTAVHPVSDVEESLGIRVEALRLTGAGYMIDFRYYVYDSEKSLPLVDREIHPYLVHQQTGAYLGIPSPSKVGALRSTPRSHYPDRTYFMLFANPGGVVKSGDKVDIVVGDYQFKDLIVE